MKLIVLGEPKAQARHRHFHREGMKFTSEYDPSATKKGTFASIVQDQAPETPFNCPLMLEINFYMHRPKGHYGTGRNAAILKPSAPEWHSGKPDIDNLQKFVQDALNKVFWRDDSLICQTVCRKLYSESPRTEIIITELLT